MFSCACDAFLRLTSVAFVIAFHIIGRCESTSVVSVTRDDEMSPMFSYAYADDCARMLIFNLTFVLQDDERMQGTCTPFLLLLRLSARR